MCEESIIVPMWPVLVLLSICPPILLIRAIRRRMRLKPGHCPCGYNLTGNTSGICPECGQTANGTTTGVQ
jgi:hypothetical protein